MKELRKTKGDTQQQVADALGIDRTTYAKYESSTNEPSIAMIRQLSTYFGVSIDYMLGNTDAKDGDNTLAGFAITGDVSLSDLSPAERAELADFAKFLLSKRKT